MIFITGDTHGEFKHGFNMENLFSEHIRELHPVFFIGKVPVLDFFARQMMAEAKKLQMDFWVCDWTKPESYGSEEFHVFLQKSDVFLFCFNNVGLRLLEDEDNIWEKNHIPVWNMIVDHPRNFNDALLHPINNLHLICPDRKHVEYAEEFYPRLASVNFMPHGGTVTVKAIPYKQRPIDVLYTGSCQPEIQNIPTISIFQDGGRDFFSQTIELMLENSFITTEEAIKAYIEALDYPLSAGDPLLRQLNEKVAGYIEAVVRRYYKQALMRMLDEAKINVEVYGSGWEAEDYTYGSTICFHPWTTSEECNALAGQAKLNLNFLPWFKDGCSERVFNNMLGGAVCLSDGSPYLKERFKDGEHLIFFNLDNLPQLVADISWLLAHPEEASHIAETGRRIAGDKDTWGCRFRRICEMAAEEFQFPG